MPITGAHDRLGRSVRLIRWITLQATLGRSLTKGHPPCRCRNAPVRDQPRQRQAASPFAAGLIPEDPARQCLPCSFS